MTDELQQLSEIKPYHIKFGCSENKCDYLIILREKHHQIQI